MEREIESQKLVENRISKLEREKELELLGQVVVANLR